MSARMTPLQYSEALDALAAVGIERDNLALAAIEAASQVDRLRHLVTRLCEAHGRCDHSIHAAVAADVRRLLDDERSST